MQRLPGVKPFSFYTGKSFGIHGALVVFALIFSAWQFQRGEKQKRANIKLINSSVRVDVVAMPKRTFQELKALQTSAPVEPVAQEEVKVKAPETPDTGKEFIKEKKKTSFADLMKQYSKKNVEKAKPQKKKVGKKKNQIDAKNLANLKGLIKRGNIVRSGQALTGNGGSGDLTALQEYASALPVKVKPFWKLPSYLASEDFKCRIRVFINSQGKLIRAVIFESSGNDEYDQRALAAVKRASPFSVPGKDITGMTSKGDILLGFPL